MLIHGVEVLGRSHGGEGGHTYESARKMARFGGAVARGASPACFPWQDRTPARLGRRSSSAMVVRAGGEKASEQRKKKASPAPLFIGEAW